MEEEVLKKIAHLLEEDNEGIGYLKNSNEINEIDFDLAAEEC